MELRKKYVVYLLSNTNAVSYTHLDVYKRQVQDLLHTEKDDDFNKVFSRVEKYENISDSMELELSLIHISP